MAQDKGKSWTTDSSRRQATESVRIQVARRGWRVTLQLQFVSIGTDASEVLGPTLSIVPTKRLWTCFAKGSGSRKKSPIRAHRGVSTKFSAGDRGVGSRIRCACAATSTP